MYVRRYDIELDPFVAKREVAEDIRVAKARKRTRRKRINRSFVSVNRMYPINRFAGTKYLSPEGAAYKDYIADVMGEMDELLGPTKLSSDGYEVTYVFFMTHDMMFTKAGDFRDVDVSNMLKAAEDAVFDFILEKDSTVVSIHGHKRVAEFPKLVVLLSYGTADSDISHCGETVSVERLYNDATVFQSSLQS